VDAQQTRRVLDRLVGYTLSPILWKKIYKGLSAGRVQSVALRLLVDRERERQAFKPVEYWSLTADLFTNKKEAVSANLVQYQGKKLETLSLATEAEVQAIVAEVEKAPFTVVGVERKRQKRRPSAPYTTSTLQQDGVNKLGLSARRIMSLAQKLYEHGHITYMRTDSTAIASTAVQGMREYLVGAYGADAVPAKPHFYANKNKGAQEAHEAIRPTTFDKTGAQVAGDPGEQKVYDLIRRRALASQMSEAELEMIAVNISAAEALFRANGQRVIYPGFFQIWGTDDRDTLLPDMQENDILALEQLHPEQHFTEPPPRYSEATLIKVLEEQGIGRPSTYAPTIATLMDRQYVRVESKRLVPEEIGFTVTDLLTTHFPNIVDTGFTVAMEEQLDAVAEGNDTYEAILSAFWVPFNKQVEEGSEKIPKQIIDETTDELCPICSAPMTVKRSRFGKFLACSRFPECRGTRSLVVTQPTGLICPICGKDLIEKRARRGIFYGCSSYPNCTLALWQKEHLPAKVAELEAAGTELPFKEAALAAFETLGLQAITPRPPRVKKEDSSKPVKKAVKKKATKKPAKKVTKKTA